MNSDVDLTFDPFSGGTIARSVASTDAQREIWNAAQMGADASRSYHEAVALRIAGPVDFDALRPALAKLVKRHESLRATFSRDGLTMLVADDVAIDVPEFDWTAATVSARAESTNELMRAAVNDPYDLEQGPLVRFRIARLSVQETLVVIGAHHIICDGWSFGVLAQDLRALYASVSSSPLAEFDATDQFTEYAAWLRSSEQREAVRDADRYWTAQFATIPEPLDLPVDRVRPLLKTYNSARDDHHISLATLNAVRAMGARENSSLFVTLLGGVTALLSRLSGQDDVVVGIASAGQAVANRPNLVGHCVHMLPVRLQAAASLPFASFLNSVRSTTLDAFEHQSLGFGQLLERLPIPRDPGRIPLIAVVFNLERAVRSSAISFSDCTVTMESVPRTAENFDLFVNAVEHDDGLVLECQYNTDLYDRSTIRRWLTAYELLLRCAVETPATPIGRLRVHTPEHDATFARVNDTFVNVPAALLVHHLVESQTLKTPGRVAIEQDHSHLTYNELNSAANQLAHHLRTLGAGRDHMVGLYLDRTPQTIVALLAVLKCGAGYVPLDPSQPLERLKVIAGEAKLTVVLTEDGLRDEAANLAPRIVSIDGDRQLIDLQSADNIVPDERSATASSAAYVLFTSGSTGVPKGVVVPHRALVNLLLGVQQTPGMTGDDVVLAITTLSFDIAVSEVLLPLTVGARVVLATRETAMDGALLRTLVESRGITFIDATPATYNMLLESGWKGGAQLRLVCTGEAMPLELARTLVQCGRELWNGYGPTETTVWSTFHRVLAPVDRVLIGRPIANTRVVIRDAQGEAVPIGVAGELFIGGAGVATGYLNRALLTEERFTTDSDASAARWYRTGDLVRLLPTAELECLGRTDDQVKVRGYRIEPGEISAVIMKWPGVRQAVVVAHGAGNGQRLVAYVVADDGSALDESFRRHLKQFLPAYMIPSVVMRVAAMPLTNSGKIDRKRLPAPEQSTAESPYVAPVTETEIILAALWSAALRIARVSVHDDFFALGGHSVLAAQILSRLRRDHGIDLSFRRVFEKPTVYTLAQFLDAERSAGAAVVVQSVIPHRADAVEAPVSALQERVWMLEELEPERRQAHSHPASWRLTGALQRDALERALQAVMQRHAMLRTSFVLRDGRRLQVTHDHTDFVLGHLDLSHVPNAQQNAALTAFFAQQQRVPFDLDRAPLFRASLIRLSDDVHVLYTLQHGLIWDGWSFDLFLRDLSACYELEIGDATTALPPLSITYGDFAAWQPEWLASPMAEAQRAWWDNILAGANEALRFPNDHPRPAVSDFAGSQVAIEFSETEVERLQQLARRHDGSLYMIVLAAYSALLHRYTAQHDILIASPMQARSRPEVEDIVGPFVNTVVQRFQLRPGMTFSELLRLVREQALDSYSRQELPFERLESRLPGIHAVFSMQDARARPSKMGPLAVRQLHVPLHLATNDLTLWFMQYPDRMSGHLNFSTEVIDRDTATALLQHLRTLLLALVATDADVVLDYISFADNATASDAALIPPTAADAPSPLVAIQNIANSTPAHIALRAGNSSLTYGDLWARSSSVANALIARGINGGATVAIDLPVGLDRAVATLAVLRAGCQLLPLAPEDAEPYRAAILKAAKPAMVLASVSSASTVALAVLETEGVGGTPSLHADVAALITSWPATISAPEGLFTLAHLSSSRLHTQVHALGIMLQLNSASVVVHALPSSCVAATHALLATLSQGACAVLISDDVLVDAGDLSDDSARFGGTTMIGTSDSWRLVLDDAWNDTGFTNGICIGGGLSGDELHALHRSGNLRCTTFGTAADAVLSSIHELTDSGENWFTGDAVPGTALRVMDVRNNSMPAGMPGWLHVAIANGEPGWVKTGFRARCTVSGNVQLLADGGAMLWLGGMPVAADTIEEWMRHTLPVLDVAVTVARDAGGVPRLVAHAVMPSGELSAATLRSELRRVGPVACIPARAVTVPALPKTSGNQPLRASLRSPFGRDTARAAAEPQTTEEKLLAEVWCEALSINTIGRNDNFFALGGTSLLCFRVIEKVRARTDVRLSPRLLLTGTLAQAAEQLFKGRVAS